jgi:hypothetical protein
MEIKTLSRGNVNPRESKKLNGKKDSKWKERKSKEMFLAIKIKILR